jgi:hypothetical protein
MAWDLHDYRLVTASAYPGMMAPLTEHPSCVCVLSGDADADLPGTRALSLERLDGVRRRWRFGDVARLADFVPKVLAEAPADDRPILLVPPRASTAWESAAAAWPGRVRLAAGPLEVVERLAEDKVYIRAALQGLGVPVPEALALDRDELDFTAVARRLDAPFIAQTPNGAGGQGTYLVRDAAELAAARQAHPHVTRWLLSRYAGDVTINVAGVVHADGVRLLPASLQISGIPQLGYAFGGYCGSDFATPRIDPGALAQAYLHTERIGAWLAAQGHRGLFGADIAVSGGDVAFLEVNPRIQGSSWLLSRLQERHGLDPCLHQHLRALLGEPLDPADAARPVLATAGSHLLVRWTGPGGVVRAVPRPDSYAGIQVTGLPALGVTLLPGAILARLESTTSLSAPDGRSLLPATTALVATLTSAVTVAPLPPTA